MVDGYIFYGLVFSSGGGYDFFVVVRVCCFDVVGLGSIVCCFFIDYDFIMSEFSCVGNWEYYGGFS